MDKSKIVASITARGILIMHVQINFDRRFEEFLIYTRPKIEVVIK